MYRHNYACENLTSFPWPSLINSAVRMCGAEGGRKEWRYRETLARPAPNTAESGFEAHALNYIHSKGRWGLFSVGVAYSAHYYRRVPPERPPSFIRPPPPIFLHRKNWYRECAPPSFIRPPPPFPSVLFLASDRVLLPVISHSTLPPCIMKFQNVRDISRGTWPTIYSLGLHARCSRYDRRRRPVGVAVVVRQWRGSKHFCKHDVPSRLQRYLSTAAALHGRRTHTVDRGTYVTAHARSRTRSAN